MKHFVLKAEMQILTTPPVYCWKCGSTDTMPVPAKSSKLAEKYRCLECGAITRVPGPTLRLGRQIEEETKSRRRGST